MKQVYNLFFIFLLTSSITYSQCIINHTPTSPQTFTIYEGVSILWGQSFTAECNGFLEYVQLFAGSSGTVSAGTLSVYSGNGVSGSPIYTQPYSEIIINQPGDPIRIDLTNDLSLNNGDQYTFEFTVDITGGVIGGSNEYSGGTIWQNTSTEILNFDFQFEVSISNTPLSVEDFYIRNKNNVKLFPNPTTEYIQISGLKNTENYSIYNAIGSEISKGSISIDEKIDVKKYSNGLYFLKFENGNTIKFIKK